MAAATIVNGPAGKGFDGLLCIGTDCNTWDGQVTWPTTDTTCTLTLHGGGQNKIRQVFIYYNVVDKTVVYSVSGDTITFTRTDTTSAAAMGVLILFN